ncbi:sodium/potassium-transporting ATPase subunit alpha-1-like isoform X1 [Hydra vulgaris]|uniref:sodium/potassium-transporting ATPase subunit alpha-1-like isoform X1 n=1 Tax=Hydra vulgaris TaxID=6087 RepID=UPI001F5E8CDE|nr:sodium/potassium-transporting ATPase subunit alpha-1-like [Hydra vulgaris]
MYFERCSNQELDDKSQEHLSDLSDLIKLLNTHIEYGLDEKFANRLLNLGGKNKVTLPSKVAISALEYSWSKFVKRVVTEPKWTQNQWDTLVNSKIKNIYKVIRNKKICYISGWCLVRGDLILLQRGDFVPADIRVISCDCRLVVNNLIATKHSLEIKSHQSTSINFLKTENILLANTQIVMGSCRGLVLQTGNRTVFSGLVKQAQNFQFKVEPMADHEMLETDFLLN